MNSPTQLQTVKIAPMTHHIFGVTGGQTVGNKLFALQIAGDVVEQLWLRFLTTQDRRRAAYCSIMKITDILAVVAKPLNINMSTMLQWNDDKVCHINESMMIHFAT